MAAVTVFVITACGGAAALPTATPGAATPTVTATTRSVATPTAPPGGPIDACSLLSADDLSAATGKSYLAGAPDAAGQCIWNTNASGANSGDIVVGYVQAQELSFIKSFLGTGGVDVTVSGHAAFWNPSQGVGSLWVDIGGGNLLVLSFPRSSDLDASYQALAIQLAEIALSRM